MPLRSTCKTEASLPSQRRIWPALLLLPNSLGQPTARPICSRIGIVDASIYNRSQYYILTWRSNIQKRARRTRISNQRSLGEMETMYRSVSSLLRLTSFPLPDRSKSSLATLHLKIASLWRTKALTQLSCKYQTPHLQSFTLGI